MTPESKQRTITAIAPTSSGKSQKITFDDGLVAYGSDRDASSPLVVGTTAYSVFEHKPSANGQGDGFLVLKQWGEPKAKQFGGGGGGRPQKTPSETASIMAEVACKCAVDLAIAGKIEPKEIGSYQNALMDKMCDAVNKGKAVCA